MFKKIEIDGVIWYYQVKCVGAKSAQTMIYNTQFWHPSQMYERRKFLFGPKILSTKEKHIWYTAIDILDPNYSKKYIKNTLCSQSLHFNEQVNNRNARMMEIIKGDII